MNEKKLTDEEIAQALLQNIEYSKTLTYFDKWGNHKAIMITDIITFIHRLQSEIETQRKIIEYQDGLPDLVEQQKAEIERLKEVNAGLALANLCDLPPNEDCLTDNEFEAARKTIAEQKAEIERLTGEKTESAKTAVEVLEQNIELQKQVDELTDKLGKVLSGIKADEVLVAKGVEQAVKDTAKEIIAEWENNIDDYIDFGDFIDRMKERYGVEVE